MTEAELITLVSTYNTPLTLVLFLYLFFKIHKLEIAINRLDSKICTIITLLNGRNGEKKK